jgi:hypothetical protein
MDPLLDPLGDRQVKSVCPPPARPLSYSLMYPNPCTSFPIPSHQFLATPTLPNVELIRKHLLEEGTIGKSELRKLIQDVTAVFSEAFSLFFRERSEHSEDAGTSHYCGRYPWLVLWHDPYVWKGRWLETSTQVFFPLSFIEPNSSSLGTTSIEASSPLKSLSSFTHSK